MPQAAMKAAVSSASARRSLLKGKRKERYSDDPEEQANLLGNDQLSQERYDEDDDESITRRTPVRFFFLISSRTYSAIEDARHP